MTGRQGRESGGLRKSSQRLPPEEGLIIRSLLIKKKALNETHGVDQHTAHTPKFEINEANVKVRIIGVESFRLVQRTECLQIFP